MLSDKIRELRRKTGLSQEELAERLDVSRQAVSKWELGSAVPTADKLVDIADFFGVSLDFLMRESTEQPPSQPPAEVPTAIPRNCCKRPNVRRKIAAWCLIGTAICAFLLIGVFHALGSLFSVGGSFTIHLDGVGVIVVLAVLCAATGAALLISLKR